MRCIAPCKHYHLCICDWRNNKQYTAKNSRLNRQCKIYLNKKTYLQTVSQKRQTVLVKLELLHFIEIVFVQASILGY